MSTEREMLEAALAPSIGDYVLGTKWSDGDPGDPWAIGFYGGEVNGRHIVNDAAGKSIRPNGFRCVGRITPEMGAWLLSQSAELERAPGKINLWGMFDWVFVNEQVVRAAASIGRAG